MHDVRGVRRAQCRKPQCPRLAAIAWRRAGRGVGEGHRAAWVCVASIDARLVARPGMEQGVLGRAARRASTRSGGLVQQRVRHSPWWRGDRTSLRLPRGPGARAARGAKSRHGLPPGPQGPVSWRWSAGRTGAGRRRAGGLAPAALCAAEASASAHTSRTAREIIAAIYV